MSEETYDYVGIVMAKSAEGDAVARVVGDEDGIEVIENPSFWDIRAKDRLVIDFDKVSEELGFDVDGYAIQHEMSCDSVSFQKIPMRRSLQMKFPVTAQKFPVV